MEHIVQFAIGVDDEAIRKRIIDTAEKQIMEELIHDVKTHLYEKDRSWYGKESFTNNPSYYFEQKIEKVLNENKDKIIEMAAEILAEKFRKTKKFKETMGAVCDQEVSNG